jgi:DNA-binding LytR/AlgR family response regulator
MIDDGKIDAVIAEDDKAIAQFIQSLLSDFPEVNVLALANNGQETIETVKKLKPRVLFLDIEMPLIDGLTVAKLVKKEEPDTLIVFTTGYSCYAADAFQLDAVDYIVKPVTPEAINRSILKIKKHLKQNEPIIIETNTNQGQRVLLKYDHDIHIIKPEDIIFIEKTDRKITIHTVNEVLISTESLNSLEKRLDNRFFRCHKSFIININEIEKIIQIAERVYEVYFYDFHIL